jgi:hypothetical protein
MFRPVLSNNALQLAPDETWTTPILTGGEFIDRIQNIARNVADRQDFSGRNGSGRLTTSCSEITLSPPSPAISAASVVRYFAHCYFISPETACRSSGKRLNCCSHSGESSAKEFSSTPEDAPSVVDDAIYLAARLCEIFFCWKRSKNSEPLGVGCVPRETKQLITSIKAVQSMLRPAISNNALQFAPDETGATAMLPGRKLIERLQNIGGNIADSHFLNGRVFEQPALGAVCMVFQEHD